jgi:two-component system, OmpR family, response regulator
MVVEDEPGLGDVLLSMLARQGWNVTHVTSGREALDTVTHLRPDAVLLDLGLGDLDGFEVLAAINTDRPSTKVIILTARDSDADRVAALDGGAAGYITKPFGFDDVLDQLTTALRASGLSSPDELSCLVLGDLYINPETLEVRRDGTNIRLTRIEFALLLHLAQNAGSVVGETQIVDHVWHYDFGERSHIVELYISYLRDKIETRWPRIIFRADEHGYVLQPVGPTVGM